MICFYLFVSAVVCANLDCSLCKPLATVVEGLIRLNVSEALVAREIENYVCPSLAKELDPAVCKMAVETYAPTVYPIMVSGEITPLGLCQLIGACEDEVSLEDRQRLAAHRQSRKPFRRQQADNDYAFKVRGSTFRIMQVSDVHFDSLYVPGSNDNCDAPMCCRSGSGNASAWGAYKCDLTQPMLDAFFQAIQQTPVDAIVWTGDYTPHDVWNETRIEQLTRLEYLAQQISANINTPIFMSLGNHDTYPCDQFTTHAIDADHLDDFKWLLDGTRFRYLKFFILKNQIIRFNGQLADACCVESCIQKVRLLLGDRDAWSQGDCCQQRVVGQSQLLPVVSRRSRRANDRLSRRRAWQQRAQWREGDADRSHTDIRRSRRATVERAAALYRTLCALQSDDCRTDVRSHSSR